MTPQANLASNAAVGCRLSPKGLSDKFDTERERHIADCGRHMLAAYARYEASDCLGDRGEADRWRLMQAEAIAARGSEQVVRMESERGLV